MVASLLNLCYSDPMKLFLDFDGVVNYFGSRSAFNRNKDCFGYSRKGTLYSEKGALSVNYAAELVKKLNDAHNKYGFTWLWLTTWVREAKVLVDPRLGTHSDGYVDWDPDSGITFAMKDPEVVAIRAARKIAALKANFDGEPFVWIDDDATDGFNSDDFTVPHLVVKPDEKFGITKSDWDKVLAFLDAHS